MGPFAEGPGRACPRAAESTCRRVEGEVVQVPVTRHALFSDLLGDISSHNEPLITLVRILVLIISILMVCGILTGKSRYPRWIIIFSPIVIVTQIFAIYVIAPGAGVYLLPAAMNVAHLIFFALSTWAAMQIQTSDST